MGVGRIMVKIDMKIKHENVYKQKEIDYQNYMISLCILNQTSRSPVVSLDVYCERD